MGYSITRSFDFEAAHSLPTLGESHKCHRLHGHLFRVEVTVRGEPDPVHGWVVDFGVLDRVGRGILSRLDHRLLNQVEGLGEPTSENLARYLYHEFAAALPGVSEVTVHESPHSRCTYRPEPAHVPLGVLVAVGGDHQLTISCAHFLVFGDGSRETVHGHSYRFLVTATVPQHGGEAYQDMLVRDVRQLLERLDRRLLLPTRNELCKVVSSKDMVEIVVGKERMTLTARDVAMVDVVNTTTEEIARLVATWLWEEKEWAATAGYLSVEIEESGECRASFSVVSQRPGDKTLSRG